MAWTPPKNWDVGELLTAANLNAHLRDNMLALRTLPVVTKTGSATLVLTDAESLVEMYVASANTLTIPTNAAVPFPIGTSITVVQLGAGQTNFAVAGGVTLRAYNNNFKLAGAYALASLIKRATDDWYAGGNLVP